MNIRFVGDSWLWTWPPAITPSDTKSWHSKSMTKISDVSESAISLTSIILSKLGHHISHLCKPGCSFNTTCNNLELYLNNMEASTGEIFVIWVSSDLRHPYEPHPQWDLRNKQVFLNQYDHFVLSSLNKVNIMAGNCPGNNYIFVGGQSGLPKYLWDAIPVRQSNMHLLSEHIINTLSEYEVAIRGHNGLGLDLSRFYMENDFIKIYDACDHKNDVDPELVDYMAFESRLYNDPDAPPPRDFNILTHPDMHHLGYYGQIQFTDYLLKYCEDNNLL